MSTTMLFLLNVGSHLVALMSSLVSFGIAIYETLKGQSILARTFWVLCIFSLFVACGQAWQDEHRNTQAVEIQKAIQVGAANSCREDAKVEHALYVGLQNLIGSQRQTIDQQQLSHDAQQKDVSSCVVSLSKMNPKVREQVIVIVVPFAASDLGGKMPNRFSLVKRYVSEVFVLTNEQEQRFHGVLRCGNGFDIVVLPQIPSNAPSTVSMPSAPVAISGSEYEIRVDASGTEWNPSHPAYMQVSSPYKDLGKCTFTPVE